MTEQLDPAQAGAAIAAQLDAWVAAGLELRRMTVPGPDAGPDGLRTALLEARGRLDRLEEILSQVIALAGGIRRQARARADAAQDAWDTESRRLRQSGRLDQYTGRDEKAAECNLATLDLRKRSRAAEQLRDSAAEGVERLRLAHRGLDGVRQDMVTSLRALAYLSHLEH